MNTRPVLPIPILTLLGSLCRREQCAMIYDMNHHQLANSGHSLMMTKSLWCKLSAIINIYPTTLVSFQYQGWYRYHRYLALPTYLYQTLYNNIHLSWWKPAGWTAQHVYYIHCNWSCQRMIILYLFAYLKHRGMHHNLKMPTALIHCG